MNTANIIMAICLILLMAVAIFLILRYLRKLSDVEHKQHELEMKEKDLQKRHNALDRWNHELNQAAKCTPESIIVTALSSLPPQENNFVPKLTYKKMASALGYKVCSRYRNNIDAVKDGQNYKYTLCIDISTPKKQK